MKQPYKSMSLFRILPPFVLALLLSSSVVWAQSKSQQTEKSKDPIVNAIVNEATSNSQLENLAYELLDRIGPRLVGSPNMLKAHEWAVNKYQSWGIDAKNEKWGEWRGWERGITHIDLVSPRLKSLEGTQLAWSPSTSKKGVTAEVVLIPESSSPTAFKDAVKSVKGKFVMISMKQPTGRPDYNWEKYAKPESFTKMKEERDAAIQAWDVKMQNTGFTSRSIVAELEKAGAAGIVMSNWSKGFGANKIFGAYTKKIPTIDLSLEDYGMLYRMVEHGDKPEIKVVAESKEHGAVPTFNTIAEIKGSEKPDEYVILSAHFDSWDGGSGATDNGTGTIAMMEAARILKKVYPNPKRTILIGLWGSEEQGLNGSRAFVEDHPEIVKNIQALFNQDSGTGRTVDLSGQGFLNSYDYLGRWLSAVPNSIRSHINAYYPASPGRGGSDFASFVAAGAPAFNLGALSWEYGIYTWHTNRDTYDKIVFDDVRSNAILAAILAYKASEDPEKSSRQQVVFPVDPNTGEKGNWPTPVSPNRKGGLD